MAYLIQQGIFNFIPSSKYHYSPWNVISQFDYDLIFFKMLNTLKKCLIGEMCLGDQENHQKHQITYSTTLKNLSLHMS